jgi:hypothetical protein
MRRVTIGQTAAWIDIDFQVLRRGSELRVIAPHGESHLEGKRVLSLVEAVTRARNWYERFVAGEVTTIGQLARGSGLTLRYVRRILQCAILSPVALEPAAALSVLRAKGGLLGNVTFASRGRRCTALSGVPTQIAREAMRDAWCIKGWSAQGLQVIESSGPDS